ncbi:hypothetical protein PSCICE_02550 [Pseudomonas cichorii]|nr:hypothetical protein [Pseudomonas cichorii]GFM48988.1 hypothetical protein PSCICE_02550 [Pseudomonas cichorii]
MGDSRKVLSPEIQALVDIALIPASPYLPLASLGDQEHCWKRWCQQSIEQVDNALNRA